VNILWKYVGVLSVSGQLQEELNVADKIFFFTGGPVQKQQLMNMSCKHVVELSASGAVQTE
jgi:hypothetical protein